jgi:hypothetical protein
MEKHGGKRGKVRVGDVSLYRPKTSVEDNRRFRIAATHWRTHTGAEDTAHEQAGRRGSLGDPSEHNGRRQATSASQRSQDVRVRWGELVC